MTEKSDLTPIIQAAQTIEEGFNAVADVVSKTQFTSFSIPYEEKDAVNTVLEYGFIYGYGNMIAHLKSAWIDSLMKNYNFSYEDALRLADSGPYTPKDQQ